MTFLKIGSRGKKVKNLQRKLKKTGFLFFVKQIALLNNIKGFVKCTDNSTITIQAEGTETDLNKFIEFCRIGPSEAEIENISISKKEIQQYNTFEIRQYKI